MQIKRIQGIEKELAPKRALIIYGPRRIGKTTMVKAYFEGLQGTRALFSVGDDVRIQQLLGSGLRKEILDWARPYEIIILDEAQYVPNVGEATKMIIDEYPEKIIILTGSSSFTISQQAGEPLTGRHFTITLLPLMLSELELTNYEKKEHLIDLLIYGAYPEVLITEDVKEKRRILEELAHSYLLKDILVLDKIKSPDSLLDILKALAFQIGNEVSYSEIAKLVGRDVKTVQRYIDILEKTFVIKKVRAFSRNMRNEITKKSKFYFYDLGIRNALINNFNEPDLRNDTGALWENFIFMELYKKSKAKRDGREFYFWRTHTGQEVDIVIEGDGKIEAYECKWTKTSKIGGLARFKENYPDVNVGVIHRDNFLEYLMRDF